MHYFVVGLGNPGEEYENTRHNTGATVLEVFRKAEGLPEWSGDKKRKALVSEGKITPPSSPPLKRGGGRGGVPVTLVFPQTFMNKSGDALRSLVKSKKDAARLVVIHDDLDIPFGFYKLSFNKSSGGHRGVESVIRALKTQAFVRVRVGIAAPSTIRKSQDEKAVEKTILGKFTPLQLATLKKLSKHLAEGLTCLITEGREKAMSQYYS